MRLSVAFLAWSCSVVIASLAERDFAPSDVATTISPTTLPDDVVTSTNSVSAPSATGTAPPTIGQPNPDLTSIAEEHNGPLTLQINPNGGNKSSDMLYGLIFEDIDHSVDGGLYAELIQNRAFQNHTLDSWFPVGGATISLNYDQPLSSALTADLTIQMSQIGFGFENTGWWGIYVAQQTYRASFWARTTSTTHFTVTLALKSAATGTTYASTNINIESTSWTYYETTLEPSSTAPDENNVFVITSDNGEPDTLHFQLISLFPPTYNNRRNGVRPDLMQRLLDLEPKFCRVPGGNNLEGLSIAGRWIWNATIGPLYNRPGREGTWGYWNTDGMGLLEWVEFCEDLGAELLLGVWSGYSLYGASIPEDGMQPFIDEVVHEIEYLTGGPETTYGAMRIADGRTDPVTLNYVEIGNEDFVSDTYGYRWTAFYNALSSAYPNIRYVASSIGNVTLPSGVLWDQHYYGSPMQMESLFGVYDNFPRNNGTELIMGEYGVERFDSSDFALYPYMEGAVAEAVYRIAIERNSDVIVSGMWAPALANVHSVQEGITRLMEFSNSPSSHLLSTSYHALRLFSNTHPAGTTILPVESDTGFHPVYWVATTSTATSTSSQRIYVKLANAGANPQQVTLNVTGAAWTAQGATVMSGPQLAANTPDNPDVISPTDLSTSDAADGCGGAALELPGWSVAVVTLIPADGQGCAAASISASAPASPTSNPTSTQVSGTAAAPAESTTAVSSLSEVPVSAAESSSSVSMDVTSNTMTATAISSSVAAAATIDSSTTAVMTTTTPTTSTTLMSTDATTVPTTSSTIEPDTGAANSLRIPSGGTIPPLALVAALLAVCCGLFV